MSRWPPPPMCFRLVYSSPWVIRQFPLLSVLWTDPGPSLPSQEVGWLQDLANSLIFLPLIRPHWNYMISFETLMEVSNTEVQPWKPVKQPAIERAQKHVSWR